MEPVRNDTTTDRRTAVELAKRLLVDSIWRTAKIEVDGVTFPDTQEIFDGRAPEGMSVDDIVTVNNIKRAWRFLLDNIDYPVDWQYIREYNRIIGEGRVRDAGRLREYGVRIGGTGWVPEIPAVESPQERVRGIDDEQEGAFRFHDNTERELDAFGAQIFEALGINVEVRDDTYLPEMIGRWGYRFPSNEEFAAFSQSSLTDVDPTHDDPDDVVIEYYDRSYLLFKLYERAVIQHDYDAAPFVSDGVIDVDSFTSFYTSVRNRRMSRAGKVLEIHIAHILDARGIEYEAQAKTENGKKPDFLFPSQAAYEDPAFPEEQLRMLASKTSIKDRFRQVADEANRIRDKHLFTLTPGDVTHPKLAQLDELHIHLVMPKVVKESYDDLIQGETMTFSRFIEEIQGLQADRPQSLTLL